MSPLIVIHFVPCISRFFEPFCSKNSWLDAEKNSASRGAKRTERIFCESALSARFPFFRFGKTTKNELPGEKSIWVRRTFEGSEKEDGGPSTRPGFRQRGRHFGSAFAAPARNTSATRKNPTVQGRNFTINPREFR